MSKTLQLILKLRKISWRGTQTEKEVKIDFCSRRQLLERLDDELSDYDSAYELSITFYAKEQKTKLPSYIGETLLEIANPESCDFFVPKMIVRVQGPQDLFDRNQLERLKKIICLNKEIFSNNALPALGVIGFNLIVLSVATGSLMLGTLIMAAVRLMKPEYNKRCSKPYEEKVADKTENTKLFQSRDEKAAFMDGVRAKDWSGYLIAFTHFRNYTNPFAFAAGMRFGVQENEVVIEAAKRAKI